MQTKLLEPTWHIKVCDMGAFHWTRHITRVVMIGVFSGLSVSQLNQLLSVLYRSGIINL